MARKTLTSSGFKGISEATIKKAKEVQARKDADKTFSTPIKSGGTYSSKTNKKASTTERLLESRRKEDARVQKALIEGAKEKALGGVAEARAGVEPRYDVRRAESELAGRQGERRMGERTAALGYTSRAGQAKLGQQRVTGAAQGRLTSIGLEQETELAGLGRQERDIRSAADLQQISALGQIESKYTTDLMNEQIRREGIARQEEQQRLARDISTVGQYGENYQAEYDKRFAIDPNDPLLPYIQMAREQKVQQFDTARATELQYETPETITAQIRAIEDANPYDKRLTTMYQALNVATQTQQAKQISDAEAEADLKQQLFDNEMKRRQVEYTTSKPYYNPSTGGGIGGAGGTTDASVIRQNSKYIADYQANYNSALTAISNDPRLKLKSLEDKRTLARTEATKMTDNMYGIQEDFSEFQGEYLEGGTEQPITPDQQPTQTPQQQPVTDTSSRYIWIPNASGGQDMVDTTKSTVDAQGNIIGKSRMSTVTK